jgi:crossover junction endodeoxyribonuclease RuvC
MYVLGLDVATIQTGWCVAKIKDQKIEWFEKGTIYLPEEDALPKRLLQLHQEISTLKCSYPLTPLLFKEQPLHERRNKKISAAIFKAHGIIEAIFHDFNIVDIPPSTVKKRTTGMGNATKPEVEKGIRSWLNLSADYTFETDDESDAVAILLTGLSEYKYIESISTVKV